MSRKLDRMRDLLHEIEAGRATDRKTLARRLGCSVRTVQRLLNDMSRIYGEVDFDPVRGGYRMASPHVRMRSAIAFDVATDLSVVEACLDAFPDSGLRKALESTLDADRNQRSPAEAGRLRRLRRTVSARAPVGRRPAPGAVALLSRALRDQRAVRLAYTSNRDHEPRERVLWPVHLASLSGEWYLFAARVGKPREAPRQYSLARMERLEVLPREAPEIPDDVSRRFKKRFARFVPPEATSRVPELKLRFTAEAAPWVEERRFHEQESRRHARDGTLVVSFPAPSLYEAFRFVLSFGPTVEVLEPKELRSIVAEAARRTARVYERPALARDDPLRELPPGLFGA